MDQDVIRPEEDTAPCCQGEALIERIPDEQQVGRLADIFKALADPTRLRIIALLLDQEVCVHALEDALGMSQSAVSHQLGYLRRLKLVRGRKVGRHVYYTLDDEHVRQLFRQGMLHAVHD